MIDESEDWMVSHSSSSLDAQNESPRRLKKREVKRVKSML